MPKRQSSTRKISSVYCSPLQTLVQTNFESGTNSKYISNLMNTNINTNTNLNTITDNNVRVKYKTVKV